MTTEPPHDPRDDLPWWNIESPIRRRIKGTYLRRISFALALLNVGILLVPQFSSWLSLVTT